MKISQRIAFRFLLIISPIVSDKLFLKLKWRIYKNKRLNLKDPQTFGEKLQWLKLYDRNPKHTIMADKIEAKEWAASIIGEEHIIPTLEVWDNVNEIDFDALPNQFVIKNNHDSGFALTICKDKSKIDWIKVAKKLDKAQKTDYSKYNKEWPYKNIRRRIFIEKFMIDSSTKELRDYKFFCFNGEPQFFKVDFDRFINHKANYYDLNWNLLDYGEVICPPDSTKNLEKPSNFNDMINIARKLAKGTRFVRIDLYNVDGKIYFGEATFFPSGGIGQWINEDHDLEIGKLLNLKIVE